MDNTERYLNFVRNYNEKLKEKYKNEILNNETIYPTLTYNGSFTYLLEYTDGINIININVHDENNNSKTYD